MQTACGRNMFRVFERRLEIVSVFNQVCPERPHRAVLLSAVAKWHDDCRAEATPHCGERDGLPVIAARGRNHAAALRLTPTEPRHVRERAANLERADGRVILVLHPKLAPGARIEKRPRELRRGGNPSYDVWRQRLNLFASGERGC